tara:strand:+ start:608 stop:1576 length:969 start_codon:yes stop_codon:yes gene_type:complete
MGLKVTNNAFGTLNAGINSSVTTVVLAAGQGALFPTLAGGDYFYATLIDTSNNLEIVKVTARSTDTMTIVRAQDNTIARAYSTNDRFELRPTAALFNEKANANEYLPLAGGTMTGDLIFSSGAIRMPGSLTSDARINFKNSSSTSDIYAKFPLTTQTIQLRPNGNGQLEFWSDGAGIGRVLGLDQDGRVTNPRQPLFTGVNNSQGYGVNTTSSTLYNAMTTILNVGSHWNGTRFTCPIAGVYQVHAHYMKDANATPACHLDIYKNGSTYTGARVRASEGATYDYPSGTYYIQCAASDFIEYYYHGPGGMHGGHSAFSIRLVG